MAMGCKKPARCARVILGVDTLEYSRSLDRVTHPAFSDWNGWQTTKQSLLVIEGVNESAHHRGRIRAIHFGHASK
jgi:hypothetical protein